MNRQLMGQMCCIVQDFMGNMECIQRVIDNWLKLLIKDKKVIIMKVI